MLRDRATCNCSCEDRLGKIQAYSLEGLPLRLVDRQGKDWLDGELEPPKNTGDVRLSVELKGTRGITTLLFLNGPDRIVAIMTFFLSTRMINLVPLQSPFLEARLHSRMMGTPGLRVSRKGSSPAGFNESKNSVG